MKFAAIIPIEALRAETGEPIPDYDIELPRDLYVRFRREARSTGQSFRDYFSGRLISVFEVVRKNRAVMKGGAK
jgi:hypothetical protein